MSSAATARKFCWNWKVRQAVRITIRTRPKGAHPNAVRVRGVHSIVLRTTRREFKLSIGLESTGTGLTSSNGCFCRKAVVRPIGIVR